MTAPSLAGFQTTMTFHIAEKLTILQGCTENNRLFKTKELIVSGAEMEQVNSFRFLGISITWNISWSSHVSTLVKKAQKQL